MNPAALDEIAKLRESVQKGTIEWLVWVDEPVAPAYLAPRRRADIRRGEIPTEVVPNAGPTEVVLRAVVRPPPGSPYRPPEECYPGVRVELTIDVECAYPATAPAELPRVLIRSSQIHHGSIDRRELLPPFYLQCLAGDAAAAAAAVPQAADAAAAEWVPEAGTISSVLWHVAHTLLAPGVEKPVGTPELRFAVGDEVLANVGKWVVATVVSVWDVADEGDDLPKPYRLRLKPEALPAEMRPPEGGEDLEVWAPDDTEAFVRGVPGTAAFDKAAVPSEAREGALWWDMADHTAERWAVVSRYRRSGHCLSPVLFQPPVATSVAAPEFWAPRLDPGVAKWLASGADPKEFAGLASEEHPQIWSFPLFSHEFCKELLAEIENYEAVSEKEGWPVRRPNSMNAYGAILNEMGLEALADSLQDIVLAPIAAAVFPKQGAALTHHHTFMVSYEPGADLGLDMHTDDSDVTFNVCLGKEFSGAGLQFCGVLGAPDHRQAKSRYHHKLGRCVVHLGAQRHGADDIESGQRRNLIIWNTNVRWRQSLGYMGPQFQLTYEREQGPPSEVCLSYTHDVDWEKYKGSRPPGRRSNPWCPPAKARHVAA